MLVLGVDLVEVVEVVLVEVEVDQVELDDLDVVLEPVVDQPYPAREVVDSPPGRASAILRWSAVVTLIKENQS